MKTKIQIEKNLVQDKDRLDNLLRNIPRHPGCYLMFDKEDRLLYVGKSKNLNNRIRSYFRNISDHSPRIMLMVRQIYEIEIIVTDNESEALTLESNLIKDKQPYFNILLKDDKKYPYVCITWSEKYPRLFITRQRHNRKVKDKFYGPYVDVAVLRTTLFLIKSVFPLRQRSIPMYKNRTCLNYSIKRCPGVCQEKISSEEYKRILKKVEMILQGRSNELKNLLEKKMKNYSDKLEYENALIIRDQIKGVNQISEKQKMTLPDDSISRDIINICSDKEICSIQLFQMRAGKLVNRLGYISQNLNEPENHILQRVIEEHYSKIDNVEIPRELLVPYELPKQKIISDWLSVIKGKRVSIQNPLRSSKAEILELVHKNASLELDRIKKGKQRHINSLEQLAELLELIEIPRRIEGYDISHIQGSDAVGSQVVFIDGLPAKQHYRKYKIKNSKIDIGHSDDFASLAEVLKRRLLKWSIFKKEGGKIKDIKTSNKLLLDTVSINDWPDLIMIDGGKGQLNSVLDVIKELDLEEEINICSLAKRNEEVFIPYRKDSLKSDINDESIILLRRLRDEAHRFAITFHRQQRKVRMTRSELSNIPGLGSKRIKILMSHFRSVEAIQLAKIEDISRVEGLGERIAKDIWNHFNSSQINNI